MMDPTQVPKAITCTNRKMLFIVCSPSDCIVPVQRQLVRYALPARIFRQSTMHASPRRDSHAIPRRYSDLFAASGASPVRTHGASRADQQKPRERHDNEKDRKIENPDD